MKRVMKHSGALALSGGTFAYWYHRKYNNLTLLAESPKCEDDIVYSDSDESTKGRASVPLDCAPDGTLFLQLKQVQVMFRHGARTPLHTVPKIEEAEYDPQFLIREHQHTNVPYVRVSSVTGKQLEWSDYELKLMNKKLRGGACCGALTSYGKDQVYLLGKDLRTCYKERLSLTDYSPCEVSVISSNIMRTVESARCVLAGLFGKENLLEYVARAKLPIKVSVASDDYNFLIPDTNNCAVLKKMNHSAMLHSDFIPNMKRDRIEVEDRINAPRDELLEHVKEEQHLIDQQLAIYQVTGRQHIVPMLNDFREMYQYDPVLNPLYQKRNESIEKIDRFWSSVMRRHPALGESLTQDDLKALVYLRKFEVEEFQGKFASGYRFHFHFDANPYFHNKHLCKVVYTKIHAKAKPSNRIPIMWKGSECLVPSEQKKEEERVSSPCSKRNEDKSDIKSETKDPKQCHKFCGAYCRKKDKPLPSFFEWYSQPVYNDLDRIWKVLADVYANPVKYLEEQPKIKDAWDHPFNFVFGRDDVVARVTHGNIYPVILEPFKDQIEENATKLMYYAMTGQHDQQRQVVTQLSAGPLMTEVTSQCEKFMKGKGHKLCLYSTHDSTLTAVLQALDIWDNAWPPFAADIRFELYKELDSDEWYVRVLYLGKVKKIRNQTEDYIHWSEFKRALNCYVINQPMYTRICASNILERIAKDIVREEDETDDDSTESKEESETPAGM
ncbi:unnamed protein product [Lymnaea stagnalis]|uniref:2-phosphoxylose phosphatase 1 n=1 Tax=Lymnaea stagnalis TaxID=6523 RepID=A0AAV2HNC8_LYMST